MFNSPKYFIEKGLPTGWKGEYDPLYFLRISIPHPTVETIIYVACSISILELKCGSTKVIGLSAIICLCRLEVVKYCCTASNKSGTDLFLSFSKIRN